MAYKILPGFEKYVIFDDGRIWSRSRHHFMNQSLNTDGYPSAMFNRKTKTTHRLIAIAFVQNPISLKEVNHIDGNKKNNHHKNLEWCTRGYNLRHCYKLKLRNSDGARKASATLCEWKVKAIRFLYKSLNYNQKTLATCFKVTQAQISSVVLRKAWAHI